MRLAYVITRSDTVGGAHMHVMDLAYRAQSDGNDVVVYVGGEGPYSQLLQARELEVVSLRYLVRPIRPWFDLPALFELRKRISQYRPDLVHCHSSKAGLVGRVAAHLAGVPAVFTAHGWAFTEGVAESSRRLASFLERQAGRFSDRIICVSEYDRQLALDAGVGNDGVLTRIHNGVHDLLPTFPQTPNKRRVLRVVSVARIDHQKDQRLLLDALAPLKDIDWDLELIGDGPLTAEVQQHARDLGLEGRVHFSGLCHDVPDRLARADIFVLASRWEGLPLSILEAMRAGLPVVASDVGGVSETILDGVTGFLVPKGDRAALTDRLHRLLCAPELRTSMGREGRAAYEREFTFDLMYERTLAVYRDVLVKRVAT